MHIPPIEFQHVEALDVVHYNKPCQSIYHFHAICGCSFLLFNYLYLGSICFIYFKKMLGLSFGLFDYRCPGLHFLIYIVFYYGNAFFHYLLSLMAFGSASKVLARDYNLWETISNPLCAQQPFPCLDLDGWLFARLEN